MRYILILMILLFFMTNMALTNESGFSFIGDKPQVQKQNVINRSFTKVVKIQRQLNSQITSTLREVKADKSSKTLLWGFMLAFLYGIVHALGPGHAKGIIASYFLSTDEKLKKVPIMALQISMTHVFTPVLLVLIIDISLRQVITNPDSQIYWFKFISYLLIFVIGSYMLIKKIIKKDNFKDSKTLAVSAGLVPCIGSLLILLFTKANEMFLTGILFVAAIGLGIGVTICTVGFASYFFRKLAALVSQDKKKFALIQIIDFAGPVFIIALSLIMLVELM